MAFRINRNVANSGLSCVDLIVTATIVALILLLSLPALAQTVEDVKAKECDARMTALGKAITMHHVTFSRYPMVSTQPVSEKPGLMGKKEGEKPRAASRTRPRKPTNTGFSWLFEVLPRVGHERLSRTMSVKSRSAAGPFDPSMTNDEQHLATIGIKEFQCPAFAERESDYQSAAPEYLAIIKQWRTADKLSNEKTPGIALTNYVAMSATHLDLVLPDGDKSPEPNGVISFRATGKGQNVIPDGLSYTIIVTETREPLYASWVDGTTAGVVAHDPNSKPPVRADASSPWKCEKENGCRHALNVGPETADGKEQKVFYRAKWAGDDPWRYGPSSKHAGGRVNHLFADGTVRAFYSHGDQEIDATVYLALVTVNGREVVKPPE